MSDTCGAADANVEIERKFLVRGAPWREASRKVAIAQGYLGRSEGAVVRVRVAGDRGCITVKGRSVGLRRSEFEYEVPRADAEAMLELCLEPPVRKTRYFVEYARHTFELDVFEGENEGLVTAEVELASEEEAFERPEWLGDEISHDHRYANSNLALRPFRSWPSD